MCETLINGLIKKKVLKFIKGINSPTAIDETIENKFMPIKPKPQFYDFLYSFRDLLNSHHYPASCMQLELYLLCQGPTFILRYSSLLQNDD